jgi:hypothetical protein
MRKKGGGPEGRTGKSLAQQNSDILSRWNPRVPPIQFRQRYGPAFLMNGGELGDDKSVQGQSPNAQGDDKSHHGRGNNPHPVFPPRSRLPDMHD